MSTPDELIVEVSENVLADVDPVAEEGEPHPIWSTMVELGWPHVGLAEPVGGPGGSLADLCALVSATARRGIGVPLLEMSLSCWVLQEPLEDLVVFARSPQWVPWGRCAERLLVVPERGEPHLVDLRAPGVSVRPGSNLAAEPRDAVHVDDRAAVTRASPAFDPELVGARAALLNSAALLGAARGALELTRQHVQQRHQFGKPLLALSPPRSPTRWRKCGPNWWLPKPRWNVPCRCTSSAPSTLRQQPRWPRSRRPGPPPPWPAPRTSCTARWA